LLTRPARAAADPRQDSGRGARPDDDPILRDDFGRPVRIRLPHHGDQAAVHDEADRVVAIRYVDGARIEFDHDSAGRVIAKRIFAPGEPAQNVAIGWDGSRLVSVDDPAQRIRYRYDAAGRRIAAETVIGGQRFERGTDFDPQGRVQAQRLASGALLRYRYHAAGGTLAAVTLDDGRPVLSEARWARAPASAVRPAFVLQPAAASRPLRGGTDVPLRRYDSRGRVVARDGLRFSYDAQGRLTAVAQGSTLLAQYRYNAFGERIAKTAGGATTLFLYDRGRLDAQLGERRLEFIDLRGLPIAVIEAGRVHWPNDVDPLLAALRRDGRYPDRESGLHYNLHRYVDPIDQRYLTPDPLGYPDGPDPYRAPRSSRRTDPQGLYEIDVHYYLTFFLARVAGLPPSLAKMIATAAQGIDDNPQTMPEAPLNVAARTLYHFTYEADELSADWRNPWNRQLRRLHASAADATLQACQRALLYGEFLHAFQDAFAHRDPQGMPFGPLFGHLRYGHDPDQTYDVRNSIAPWPVAVEPPGLVVYRDAHQRPLRSFPDFVDNAERALTMEQMVFDLVRRDWPRADALEFDQVRATLLEFNRAGEAEYHAYLRANTHSESHHAYLQRKRGEWEYKVAILDESLVGLGLGSFSAIYSDVRGELFDVRYDPQFAVRAREQLLGPLDHGPPDRFAGVLLPRDRR
ncbi:MAG TPA: DUF6765 family protein, partial [Burkholderiaceae bacterium]|nr:DUF6765 family protein [Burkholderiaceae bacterium]